MLPKRLVQVQQPVRELALRLVRHLVVPLAQVIGGLVGALAFGVDSIVDQIQDDGGSVS
jgi:hypothetical protein